MPFVGFQKQQDDSMLAAFIGDSEEYLRNLSFVNLDKIEEHEFAIMYNGKIYLVEEKLVEADNLSNKCGYCSKEQGICLKCGKKL